MLNTLGKYIFKTCNCYFSVRTIGTAWLFNDIKFYITPPLKVLIFSKLNNYWKMLRSSNVRYSEAFPGSA